ncbi:hypothetical protein C0993_002285 [Termitomyces sp. T159_Od127]|nr:hypothetical protein C0993_002285 [Termitomyces sp. T159_Od127]
MSAPTSSTNTFLATSSLIVHANLLVVQVQGLGIEAPCNKVKEMMHLWQKWQSMWGNRIIWKWNEELLEWCMVRYRNNISTEWLVPFANDFTPAALSFDKELEALPMGKEPIAVSFMAKGKEAVIMLLVEQDLRCQDKFWQEVIKELEVDVQQCIAKDLEVLVQEGLGLGEATGTSKGSWQGQGEEQDAKERTSKGMAGTALGVAAPATPKAPISGTKRLVLPVKRSSPTKPAFKRRGR